MSSLQINYPGSGAVLHSAVQDRLFVDQTVGSLGRVNVVGPHSRAGPGTRWNDYIAGCPTAADLYLFIYADTAYDDCRARGEGADGESFCFYIRVPGAVIVMEPR